MIDRWIEEIRKHERRDEIGMILVHNGIVRATSRDGRAVKGMILTYDKEKLESIINSVKEKEGIVEIKVWINEGHLKIGDDIMKVLVAGSLRTNVIPALQELVGRIKNEVVNEEEIY